MSQVWDLQPFAFKEVDIIDPKAKAWRDVYEFDVPVVCFSLCVISETPVDTCQIHISKAQALEEQPSQCGQAVKLMHRFTPDEVKQKMDHVETA